MQKLVLDHESRSKLLGAGSQVELCDEAGETFGYFVPVQTGSAGQYAWLYSQISEEELDRRSQQRGDGKTTAEVLCRVQGQP